MSAGLKHGTTYTQVSYFYPDQRPTAQSAFISETFIFEEGKGSFTPSAEPNGYADDRLTVGLTTIDVRPSWRWREVLRGVYNTSHPAKPTFDPVPPAITPPDAPRPKSRRQTV